MFSPAPQGGRTPLHIASLGGHLEVVGALLARGADVEAKTNVSIARLRPLSFALTHAHAECAWLPLRDVPVCIPLLLFLKTALRLQGLSAIANTRLGQSGSGRSETRSTISRCIQCEISIPTPSRHTFSLPRRVMLFLAIDIEAGPWPDSRGCAGLE
jgi:hypothetical protein